MGLVTNSVFGVLILLTLMACADSFIFSSKVANKQAQKEDSEETKKYCAYCFDDKALRLRHHYDNKATGRRVNVAEEVAEFKCEKREHQIFKCTGSCMDLKLDYNDPAKNESWTTHYMACALGAVEKMPGYEDNEFMRFKGVQTIHQKIRDDLNMTIEFFTGADSMEGAKWAMIRRLPKEFQIDPSIDPVGVISMCFGVFMLMFTIACFTFGCYRRYKLKQKKRVFGKLLDMDVVYRKSNDDESAIIENDYNGVTIGNFPNPLISTP